MVTAPQTMSRNVSRRQRPPGGWQLTVVVIGIAACAAIAGIVAVRVRQHQDRLANRHQIEARVRDGDVVDALRSEVEEFVQIGPPLRDAPEPEAINSDLRPGLPVSLADLVPDQAAFAVKLHGRIGGYDVYVVDADRFAEKEDELYGEWLSSTELIPIDPFAAARLPGAPRLRRGEVIVGVDADDDGSVSRVVVVGEDPIFSNAAVLDTA